MSYTSLISVPFATCSNPNATYFRLRLQQYMRCAGWCGLEDVLEVVAVEHVVLHHVLAPYNITLLQTMLPVYFKLRVFSYKLQVEYLVHCVLRILRVLQHTRYQVLPRSIL